MARPFLELTKLISARLQASCVSAAKGAATARAKNGPVREELRAAHLAPCLNI